jgi:hypothetical protein
MPAAVLGDARGPGEDSAFTARNKAKSSRVQFDRTQDTGAKSRPVLCAVEILERAAAVDGRVVAQH